jgi:hypothetical protein
MIAQPSGPLGSSTKGAVTMSMQGPLFGAYHIPEDTHRIAHAAFPKGNLYLQLYWTP